jgi:hypothetical protein
VSSRKERKRTEKGWAALACYKRAAVTVGGGGSGDEKN